MSLSGLSHLFLKLWCKIFHSKSMSYYEFCFISWNYNLKMLFFAAKQNRRFSRNLSLPLERQVVIFRQTISQRDNTYMAAIPNIGNRQADMYCTYSDTLKEQLDKKLGFFPKTTSRFKALKWSGSVQTLGVWERVKRNSDESNRKKGEERDHLMRFSNFVFFSSNISP